MLHQIEGPYLWQKGSKRGPFTIKYKPYYEQEVKCVGRAKTGYSSAAVPM